MSDVEDCYDVVVVGAGVGGIYAAHRFTEQGLSVLGLESAGGVGGVWYHNRYPGARVDNDSLDYCYFFSPELFNEWRWEERYADQPTLLKYLNFVAERLDVKRRFLFNTTLIIAEWKAETARYQLTVSTGRVISCKFLVMATGNLSASRSPDFPGLDKFKGQWLQSSRWPLEPVDFNSRRVAVIGTGSSGVQAVPVIAQDATQLYVFQRSPNFAVPAQNRNSDEQRWRGIASDVPAHRSRMLASRAGVRVWAKRPLRFADYSPAEQQERLECQWNEGGQGMNSVFLDQAENASVNEVVADFVRTKIRERVNDPAVADQLCPYDHAIGTRRLILETGYYEAFNQPNVTLVNIADDPIVEITEGGIRTENAEYHVDTIVFALGFSAFRGAVDQVDIRVGARRGATSSWARGPRTLLGLMTEGMPNFFMLTGPGSPSVLASMMIMNEEHVNFVAELIEYMKSREMDVVEPEKSAIDRWTEIVAEAAQNLLRLQGNNYMVHINDDGSRVFMPYIGGLASYTEHSNRIREDGFSGFRFSRHDVGATSLSHHAKG